MKRFFQFFHRKISSEGSPLLFVHGDDSTIAHVHERESSIAFDEWIAETERTRGGRTSQFLGVSIRQNRLKIGVGIFSVILMIFVAKAAHLQIVNGSEYRALAEGNRARIEMIPALRGVIYDRNKQVLADNAPTFRLTATVADLPKGAAYDALLALVAATTDVPFAEILSHTADGADHPDEPIVVVDKLSYDIALKIMLDQANYPGFAVEASTERRYVTNTIPTLSHILGYTGRISEDEYALQRTNGYRLIDDLGKTGVEKTYETALRGTYGKKVVEVDAFGHETNMVDKVDPVNGANLQLSIDASLTTKIEEVLKAHLGTHRRAAVIVEDPKSGELLALVSTPTFDSNQFSGGISQENYSALSTDPDHPLFNRAIGGSLPPGSTFKLAMAAAAVSEGIIDRNTTFLSTGGLEVGGSYFRDWKAGGHGLTNVTRALAESINTFFYYIGGGYSGFTGLGVEKIASYANRFGFGKAYGIDLPGESIGFVPNKAWKEEVRGEKWYVGDTYNLSIGQGDLLVTPLQIAMTTSVFANGGILYQPHVAHALMTKDRTQPIAPVVLNPQVVDANAIEIVREGLRQTVVSGSGRALGSLPVTSAGKTGTAQWSKTAPTHAWYTGFAPYEDPQVVITVVVEEGGGGDVICVPIARDILNWWFTQYNVSPTISSTTTQP